MCELYRQRFSVVGGNERSCQRVARDQLVWSVDSNGKLTLMTACSLTALTVTVSVPLI